MRHLLFEEAESSVLLAGLHQSRLISSVARTTSCRYRFPVPSVIVSFSSRPTNGIVRSAVPIASPNGPGGNGRTRRCSTARDAASSPEGGGPPRVVGGGEGILAIVQVLKIPRAPPKHRGVFSAP